MVYAMESVRDEQDVDVGQELNLKAVLETYAHEVDETYVITIDGDEVETTENHLFYDEDGNAVPAQELQAGDELATAEGDTATVDDVECVHHDEPVMVYNICVADDHTYFVGDHSVLVHNMCAPKKGGGNARPSSMTGESGSKADVLAQNRERGRSFEQQEFAKFKSQNNNAVEQITVKSSSGVRTRVDAIGLDANGNVVINEYKSSLTAPLTSNQKIAFPEIFESGGTVVGKGKGIFSGGYHIPSGTKVTIIRPE